MKKVLKIFLGIILSPVMLLMWVVIKIGVLITYVSGLALGLISVIFALIGAAYFLTGSTSNGIIGLVIAYLISPYGIPMFAIMALGGVQRIRENIRCAIYE
ncbi:MAG: CD1845 family protein [Firmicutes bacterium]|nr:CD1845 family protein [Bacillota bacterium]